MACGVGVFQSRGRRTKGNEGTEPEKRTSAGAGEPGLKPELTASRLCTKARLSSLMWNVAQMKQMQKAIGWASPGEAVGGGWINKMEMTHLTHGFKTRLYCVRFWTSKLQENLHTNTQRYSHINMYISGSYNLLLAYICMVSRCSWVSPVGQPVQEEREGRGAMVKKECGKKGSYFDIIKRIWKMKMSPSSQMGRTGGTGARWRSWWWQLHPNPTTTFWAWFMTWPYIGKGVKLTMKLIMFGSVATSYLPPLLAISSSWIFYLALWRRWSALGLSISHWNILGGNKLMWKKNLQK